MTKKEEFTSEQLVEAIVEAMQDKKAENVVSLDLRETESAVTDFFVICHGNSDTQVGAIADGVERGAREKLKEKPWHKEGKQNAQWVLLDYVNVVVHIFYGETRELYRLEQLWGDAKITSYEYQV